MMVKIMNMRKKKFGSIDIIGDRLRLKDEYRLWLLPNQIDEVVDYLVECDLLPLFEEEEREEREKKKLSYKIRRFIVSLLSLIPQDEFKGRYER